MIEKKFWWRNAKDDWEGLVSKPVEIQWKEGKDLTNGMLSLVKTIYDEEAAGKTEETAAKKQLKEKMDNTALDGLSFFAWFGFRGRNISDEEHEEATKKAVERRRAIKAGEKVDAMEEDEDDDDEEEYEWEIFPTGDDLAISIAEDLWPNALQYFSELPSHSFLPIHVMHSVDRWEFLPHSPFPCRRPPSFLSLQYLAQAVANHLGMIGTAQELDDMSDMEFEDEDEDEDEDMEGADAAPSKKRKV